MLRIPHPGARSDASGHERSHGQQLCAHLRRDWM